MQKDPEFNADDYPYKADDYSIQLIQIAESTGGELFVYTYQPCQATTYLVATEINMSLSEDVDGTKLYGLTLINTSGVFGKYKVNDFVVRSDSVRYYNITSIYREWISGIDAKTDNDNTINEVPYKVGRLYTAATVNGKTVYSSTEKEVVIITDKLVGTVRYSDGVTWATWDKCDSHFVAFSTDHEIDRLLEADVSYVSQAYKKNITGVDYESAVDNGVTLTYDQKVESSGNGFLAQKYRWNRIQSAAEFVKNEKIDDESKAQISKMQWVLRFAETDYTAPGASGVATTIMGGLAGGPILGPATAIVSGLVALIEGLIKGSTGTYVSEVTILRLMFETDGIVYNLGAVDNKQTTTKVDDVSGDVIKDFLSGKGIPDWAWWVIIAVAAVVAVVLICIFVPGAINVVILIFKGLWIVISAPFKGIAALVRKIKEKKDGA